MAMWTEEQQGMINELAENLKAVTEEASDVERFLYGAVGAGGLVTEARTHLDAANLALARLRGIIAKSEGRRS